MLQTFSVATNEYRGGNGERTEYHACVAWDRLAEICGQFLSKGQLVDVEGRPQTRQSDDAGKRHSVPSGPESRLRWQRTTRAIDDGKLVRFGDGRVTRGYAAVHGGRIVEVARQA